MTVLFAGDIRTREILVRAIPAKEGKVRAGLNQAGTISCTVGLPLTDPHTGSTIDLPNLLTPGKSFLGWAEPDGVINCGPIWQDQYEFDTGQYTLNAAGWWSLLDPRFVLPVLGARLPRDVSTTVNGSLRSIAKKLVQQAQSWSGGMTFIYEPDFPGENTRTYLGSDLKRLGEALEDITNVIDGPDIDFRTTVNGQFIDVSMVTGDPELKQVGGDHVWDTSVPGSAVKGTTLSRDGTVLVTHQYETGDEVDGVQLQAKSYSNTLLDAGFPMFEDATNRSSVIQTSTLQSYADGAVVRGSRHLETWGFSAQKNATPRFGTYRPGDYGQLVMGPNPRKPAGRYRVRIMGVSAGLDDFAKLELAPERA